MCRYEYYRSKACNHYFPKVQRSARTNAFFNDYHPTIAVPQSLTCTPVKLALKFYHDQVVYLPADMSHGSKIEMPRCCPIVHMPPNGPSFEAHHGQQEADFALKNAMLQNGLGYYQEWQVEKNAAVLDQCSNRAKPGHHDPAELQRHKTQEYPSNMYDHVQSVKAYQSRDRAYMLPNVYYFDVEFGCGGPFSTECLRGWNPLMLVTHRLHLWSDYTTHPKPCNDQCLAGWSGPQLDSWRWQTWPGDDAVGWRDTNYPLFAQKHLANQDERFVWLSFTNIRHRHADQWRWNGRRFMRLEPLPLRWIIEVPEIVMVPLPRHLYQVLPNKHKSKPTLPGVETPEMAEERRQKARVELRKKIARDHSVDG